MGMGGPGFGGPPGDDMGMGGPGFGGPPRDDAGMGGSGGNMRGRRGGPGFGGGPGGGPFGQRQAATPGKQLTPDDVASYPDRDLYDPDIIRTIVEYGDMDRPGILVKKLLRKPAILRCAAPLLRSGLLSVFKK